ncbi:MAG: sensor histidine kinase [Muribaculaceae bacterium]|nr:sensor histidine kinase [Muribaculaceae bacterium]
MFRQIKSLIILLLCFSVNARANNLEYDDWTVLYLSSYSAAMPSFFNQIDGIQTEFSKDNRITMDIMSMDSKRIGLDPENLKQISERIAYRIKMLGAYNAFIAADDNALNFALSIQDSILKDTPIVFLGINDYHNVNIQKRHRNITGVMEVVSLPETVDMMLRLFPESDSVYVIVDNTPTCKEDYKNFMQYWDRKKSSKKLDVINLNEMSFCHYQQLLRKIPHNAPVLLLSAYFDNSGKSITLHENMKIITDNLAAPVFHLWAHGIGEGVLGGKIISHYEQGRNAALIVRKIKGGQRADDIPVITKNVNRYMFDYNQMKRFEIDESMVPEDTVIINKPESFYHNNKGLVWAIITAFFLMLALIITLIIFGKKRKQINKSLVVERNKALEADTLKSMFLANVSHEIRTPLNAIVGFSELLMTTEDNEEKEEFCKIIRDNNDQLLMLINDILDLSRLETGSVSFLMSEFSIATLCQEVYNSYVLKFQKLPLTLEYIPNDEDIVVYQDNQRVKELLYNFINNAIKNTAKGGVKFWYEIQDNGFKISVKDTGKGIPKENQEEIFGRFVKLDQFTPGTGLGLCICKTLVEALKGKIGLDSTVGVGTTFWVWLPSK